jgi:hypothetical protein
VALEESGTAYYETADVSLLAKTPATIEDSLAKEDQDWPQMRNYLEQRLYGMRNWRTPWWMHWGELAANILPRRYLWLITPNNMTRGLPINQDVVDSTPAQALGVCAAGMMDGLSSPTKTWFEFESGLPGVELDTAGKRWVNTLQDRVYDVLAGSNFYDQMHQMYEDEIVFGTAPMIIYEHKDDVINCHNPCAGEYYAATGGDLKINTLYREFTLTTNQIVDMFGYKAIANTDVAALWNTKTQMETEQIVAHCIEPNFPAAQHGQNPRLGVVKGGWKYREYYWLRGKSTPQPLSVRGFSEKPFMCPRWNIRSNDPYGRSPGMDALPDVRQLHQMTRRLGEAIDKMVRPPMLADVSMKNQPASTLPGRVTYVPSLGKDTGMRPSYVVNPQVGEMMELIKQIQGRVEKWFYNDVFLMMAQMEGVQPRNELEINERKGEKLLRLGPVIERNLREMSNGLERVVSIMNRRQLIPPKPSSMRGIPIAIKFVSKLALIQKASKTASIERTLQFAGSMEAILPGTLDNIDHDKTIRKYGDDINFDPGLWNDQATMDMIRKTRSQAQQAMLASQQAQKVTPAIAQAAKNMSQVDVGGGQNAVQALLGSGGGAPGG